MNHAFIKKNTENAAGTKQFGLSIKMVEQKEMEEDEDEGWNDIIVYILHS